MAFILELYKTPEILRSVDRPSYDLYYQVVGTENEDEVITLVEATLPQTYKGLSYESWRGSHVGGGVWEINVHYANAQSKETGESQYAFETGGGHQKVTQSLETIASYYDDTFDTSAPDFKGAIGVNGDRVEGTDITVPTFNFSETHYLDPALVTETYKNTLFALTGRVNNATFKGRAKGEVLFMGAAGTKRGSENWEVKFSFAASPNVTDLEVGDLTGIDKEGWHYLWMVYEDQVDGTSLVKRPRYAYVERVYYYGDFSLLGIGT